MREISLTISGQSEFASDDQSIKVEFGLDNLGTPVVWLSIGANERTKLDPDDADFLGIGFQRVADAVRKEKARD